MKKAMQRALLQYRKPQNKELVYEALLLCGRQDLIGNGKKCLVSGNVKLKSQGLGNKTKGVANYKKKFGKEFYTEQIF